MTERGNTPRNDAENKLKINHYSLAYIKYY
jgi:hypothetical protein